MRLRPLVHRLSILTKQLEVIRLTPNWAQEEYLDLAEQQLHSTGRIRIIVLKARQLGVSTITEAVLFTLAMCHDYYRGMVVAHENDASEHLLQMTHLYNDTYPFRALYTTKHLTRNHIQWNETGSSIKIATAGNKAAGRSKTVNFLHASEVAFWPEPTVVMLGLRQTIPNAPGTGIIIESTANGVGNWFHQNWQAAEARDSEYVPLFFPWWRHPEYMASAIGLPYHNLGNLDAEERALRAMGLSDDRLAWRRWALRNLANGDLRKFMQEYPATADEAFVSSGTNVFPFGPLRRCYEPQEGVRGYLVRDGHRVSFVPEGTGPLTIYKAPADDIGWGQYFIGADPTRTTQGDFGVAQIINRITLEQVAVWRGRIDPGTFAEELFKIGLYYNTAEVSPEKEGPGQLTIGKLLGMNYPAVWRHAKIDRTPGKSLSDIHGWSTTAQTKHLAIGWLLKCVMDADLVIHDSNTFTEMQNYVTTDTGTYGPANEEGYDDTVMALAIAVTCHMLSSPVTPYGGGAMVTDDDEPFDPENLASAVSGATMPWEGWKGYGAEDD